MKEYFTRSPQETAKLAEQMAREAKPNSVIALIGDLGAGKTIFTKGFALGLDISEPVTSPTFTLINEYTTGRLVLYHFDIYRIDDVDELYEIGFSDYLNAGGVCLIEWADKFLDELPKGAVLVEISRNGLDEGRRIQIREL